MMEEVIINTTSNDLYDSKQDKARAIVIDEDNMIYIMNMDNSFNLPGGTKDGDELPIITIKRELNEELGLTNINPIPFKVFKFYHEHFPSDDGENFDKRLNVVTVYVLHINSTDLGESKFTDYEINHHDKIEKHTIDEIIELLKIRNNNVWKPFTDKEITIILKEYKKEII